MPAHAAPVSFSLSLFHNLAKPKLDSSSTNCCEWLHIWPLHKEKNISFPTTPAPGAVPGTHTAGSEPGNQRDFVARMGLHDIRSLKASSGPSPPCSGLLCLVCTTKMQTGGVILLWITDAMHSRDIPLPIARRVPKKQRPRKYYGRRSQFVCAPALFLSGFADIP